jgi:hypothetical protein
VIGLFCDLAEKLSEMLNKIIEEIIPGLLDDIEGVIIKALQATDGIKVTTAAHGPNGAAPAA